MGKLKTAIVVLLIIIASTVAFYWYIGGFEPMPINEVTTEFAIVAGTQFTGPYNQVNKPMIVTDSILRANKIKCTKGFGIYYDDPKSTPEEKCKSFVGNIIAPSDYAKIEQIQALGLVVDTLQVEKAIQIEFKSRTPMSFLIGPMRAYPKLVKYCKSHQITPTLAIEIYDMPKQMTYFIMQY